MNHKRTTISIVLATVMLVSLFAVISSAASVSGTVMTGTGPAITSASAQPPTGYAGYADFFAVDTSGTLWHTPMNGNNTWDSLGGVCTSSPAAVSWNSSYFRLDVFVRGSNGALYHKYYYNGWSGWESLGGQLTSGTGPAVASWSAGRVDVFAEGTNGALYHKWWNGATWSAWESLGGTLTASPAAASPSTGVVDVFARGSDGAVWQRAYNHGWSSWTSLGGHVLAGTGPAVSQDLWVIVQGTDHQLWYKGAYNGAGTAWASTGTLPAALSTASPAAALISPRTNTWMSVSDTSGNIWRSGHSANGLWNNWTSVGSPP